MAYTYTVSVPSYSSVMIEDSFLHELIQHTSSALDIEPQRLYDKTRTTRVKFARWFIWEIVIAVKQFTLKEAGNIFGGYDHTTVMYGLSQLPLDLKQNELLKVIYEGIVKNFNLPMELILEQREQREFKKKDKLIRMPKIEV